jgi:class 3 adenylate cyclase
LDVTYDRLSPLKRLSQLPFLRYNRADAGTELIETIDQLRRSMRARNKAFRELETIYRELSKANARLDEYAGVLENRVKERTEALHRAKQALLELNRNLKSKVKRQVHQLERYNELRRYLSPKLTAKILNGDQAVSKEPKRKMMTVVFTDIRGFSNLTDSLESEELFHLLDRYLSEMIHIIHTHDGTLNKIIGDGLLIFFNDPVEMADHGERAVRMAVDMQCKVSELAEEWRRYGHELAIGIGINTGFMTVGNIGSDIHRDYTVIGNQVNVAARLESLSKGGEILLSQRTYARVKDWVKAEDAGEVTVKGIHSPVRIHRVIW